MMESRLTSNNQIPVIVARGTCGGSCMNYGGNSYHRRLDSNLDVSSAPKVGMIPKHMCFLQTVFGM